MHLPDGSLVPVCLFVWVGGWVGEWNEVLVGRWEDVPVFLVLVDGGGGGRDRHAAFYQRSELGVFWVGGWVGG